jgi:phosphate transport system substrate-binding protein
MKTHILPFGFLIALLLIFSGCEPKNGGKNGSDELQETVIQGEITIVVDESFESVMNSMIDTYENLYPKSHIKPVYLPGELAIQEMLNSDSIRLVITTRVLTEKETEILKEQRTSPKTNTIAKDAIALIINPQNQDSLLTRAQLTAILTGTLTNWKEINPESPLDKISLVFDNAASSTARFLKDSLLDGSEITGSAFAANSYPEIFDFVSKTPGALGVIGIAWISDHDDLRMTGFKRSVRVAALETRQPCSFEDPFLQPYQGYMKDDCYLLTREVYAILRETKVGLGTGFVSYMASDNGQRIFLKSGLVPAYGVPRLIQLPSK